MEHIPGEISILYIIDKVVISDEQVRELYPVEYTTIDRTQHLTPRNMHYPLYIQDLSLDFF
jgi:hypothetical protein